jgi:protein O-mannosyl-transferase
MNKERGNRCTRSTPPLSADVAAAVRPSTARRPLTAWVVSGLLLLAVLLVFGQTVRHEFVNYDDSMYVYENPRVCGGLSAEGLTAAIRTPVAGNWHPVTVLSHMLDCQIYGLAAGGHHLTNVLLHAATAILLFLVFRRMTGDVWPSALLAALFAVHPLRAESVAWVAERKDVLSGFFCMLTLGAYAYYARRRFSLGRYLAVMAPFALGLMAKPVLVTLPFVLLLLDYWPLGRLTRPAENVGPASAKTFWLLLLEKIPLVALSAATCVATWLAQNASGTVAPLGSLLMGPRLANALVCYVAYVGRLLCPVGLTPFYPYPGTDLLMARALGALALLMAITAGALAARRRCPYLLVGWFWYLGTLVPMIGLVQVGAQAMADRYTYIPQIGLGIAIAWAAADFAQRGARSRRTCGIVSVLVLALLAGRAWSQTSHWRNSEAIWTWTLACGPNNAVAQNNLAWIRATSPDAPARNGAEALRLAQEAVQLSGSREPIVLDTLAAAYAELGQFPKAVEVAQHALSLASAREDRATADGLRTRITLYRAGRPYREPRIPQPGK